MSIRDDRSSIVITYGREQPPLEYGPQRIHYAYSVGIPQAYLTLFSILQGVVFSILLTNIPLSKETALTNLWIFALQQYLYLPYIISLAMVTLTWLHQVSITLTGGWPHSFLQVSLVIVLTLFEVLAVQNTRTLPSWLFFTGCICTIGGSILMRTGMMRHLKDFDPKPSFQRFGESLKKWEIFRGKQYILIGTGFITLALGYPLIILQVKNILPSLIAIIPWSVYFFSLGKVRK